MSCVDSVVMVAGQPACSAAANAWNSSGGTPEAPRVAADLVERDQPEPAVEGGVLDALGHHRAAGLLEAHDELGAPRGVLPAPRAPADPAPEHEVADQVEGVPASSGRRGRARAAARSTTSTLSGGAGSPGTT